MDPNTRLRIATRIHFALLRQYGEDVAVSTLLGDGADAREALWVCEASGRDELVVLARQFSAAPHTIAPFTPPVAEPARAVPQAMAWAQQTSGFGVSRLPEATRARAASPGRGSALSRWLRGS